MSNERLIPSIHGMDHLPGAPDPIPFGDALFEIKVFEDAEVVVAGDGAFKFAVPEDLDGAILAKAEAWVTEPSGGGDVIVSLRNDTASADLLSDPLQIDSGERNSKTSSAPMVVDEANATVAWADELWINVDNAGSGAKGLGVAVYFISLGVAAIVVEGGRGEPGGVTSFEGDWSGSTVSYPAGTIVIHDGVAYLSIADHTSDPSTEPGVGVDSDTVWAPVVEVPLEAAVNATISANGPIPDGPKGSVRIPFAGTIVDAWILAEVAGDATVDIWKCDFGGYPPSSGDSITGGSPLTLVASIKNQDSTLTGWSTSLAVDDILVPVVSDVTLINRLSLALKVVKD